jgi:uncharacterized protein YjbI with pentapeptide repeats
MSKADLVGARLREVNLSGAKLWRANLREADLYEADLSYADLSEADLWQADLKEVRSLQDTDLRRVNGLTKEQLKACKARGAIIDEDTPASPPQSPISLSLPSQSNHVQAPSAPATQENIPTSDLRLKNTLGNESTT